MSKKLSVEETKAVAEAAITARQKATDAKAALESAGGADEALQTALDEAETAATAAEAAATALSQNPNPDDGKDKKIKKLKRKQGFIARELEELGADDEDDEGDDDEEDDVLEDLEDSTPLTVGAYKRIQAKGARETALQMVKAIEDEEDREAVRAALKSVVVSGDPDADFKKAVAIANADRNSKVLEELARTGNARRAPTRTGAAPKKAAEPFVATALEQSYMKAFNLTEKDILAAREKAATKA